MKRKDDMSNWEKALLIIFAVVLTIALATVIVTFVIAEKNGLTFVEQWKEWLKAMHIIKDSALLIKSPRIK